MKKTMIIFAILLSFGRVIIAQDISPNIVIKDINGNSTTFGKALNNEAAILFFWSTSCRPCIAELTSMTKLEDQWKDKIKVIAVSMDDARSAGKIKSLVKSRKWKFDIYVDETNALYKALNLNSIPASFIIDNKGNIKYSHVGYKPGDEMILLKKALQPEG